MNQAGKVMEHKPVPRPKRQAPEAYLPRPPDDRVRGDPRYRPSFYRTRSVRPTAANPRGRPMTGVYASTSSSERRQSSAGALVGGRPRVAGLARTPRATTRPRTGRGARRRSSRGRRPMRPRTCRRRTSRHRDVGVAPPAGARSGGRVPGLEHRAHHASRGCFTARIFRRPDGPRRAGWPRRSIRARARLLASLVPTSTVPRRRALVSPVDDAPRRPATNYAWCRRCRPRGHRGPAASPWRSTSAVNVSRARSSSSSSSARNALGGHSRAPPRLVWALGGRQSASGASYRWSASLPPRNAAEQWRNIRRALAPTNARTGNRKSGKSGVRACTPLHGISLIRKRSQVRVLDRPLPANPCKARVSGKVGSPSTRTVRAGNGATMGPRAPGAAREALPARRFRA